MAGTDTNGDCGTETFEYPSDRTAGTIYMYGDWSTDFFDNPRDRKLVHQIFLNHRSKQHPDAIMDFEANKMELVRQIASSSDVDEIMLDFFASDISTQNLEITWEALKLNPMNEYVWESRRRILVGLGKLHEELTYLNSNADGDDKLDNEFFWNYKSVIVKILGTKAAEEQRQFTKSILSVQPHKKTAWKFMFSVLPLLQQKDVPKEIEFTKELSSKNENKAISSLWDYMLELARRLEADDRSDVLIWVNHILADDGQNNLAWSFRKSLVVLLPTNAKKKELEFIKEIMNNDPTNSFAWLHMRWFVERFMEELGIHIIDTELKDVTDVLKYRENNHAWRFRQWVLVEKHESVAVGEKRESIKSIIREEYELTRIVLFDDVKNIYAWSHRQWTLEKFGGWEEELSFCEEILENDIYDAFAWNQKAFVINRCGQEEVSQIKRNLELDYARKAICTDPKNEFPWMYLTCLYQDRLVVYYKLELVYKSICLAGMKHRLDVFLNRRQYINALSTVLELICCGYKPTDVVCDTIARLCSSIKLVAAMNEPCPCAATKITISECVTCSCSILQFLDPGDRRHWESLSEDALNSL